MLLYDLLIVILLERIDLLQKCIDLGQLRLGHLKQPVFQNQADGASEAR